MYYVYNVIKYLSNGPYNDATIIQDIDATFDVYGKKTNNLMNDFAVKLSTYLQMRIEECVRFSSFMMSNGYPWSYQEITNYYFLPFRYSRNPMADKRIFERIYNTEGITLDQVILNLLSTRYNVGANKEFLDRLNWFMNSEFPNNITFDNFGKIPRLGHLGHMLLSSEQMIQEYLIAKDNKAYPNFNKIIANYGELMFYYYLLNKHDDTQIYWVSRDLGDGFGYDLALYDIEGNYLKLYEVKTQSQFNTRLDIDLTTTEQNMCDAINQRKDEEYHIIRIRLNDTIDMVDIDQKNNEINDLMVPNRTRILTKKDSRYTII